MGQLHTRKFLSQGKDIDKCKLNKCRDKITGEKNEKKRQIIMQRIIIFIQLIKAKLFTSWPKSLSSRETFMNFFAAYLVLTACCLAFCMFCTRLAILATHGRMSASV